MKLSLYKKIASVTVTLLVLLAAVGAVLNAQFIKDAVLYYQYEPNDTIASFVEQTGMNDRGKFMFYASHPSLETADTFNIFCDKHDHVGAVLGCYDGRRIYIYDIVDPRLDGIRPTTAAHEMLHAAYGRLSQKDRDTVDSLLEAEYAKLATDAELSERMAYYAETQPGDRSNELHSIIGTEIAAIDPDLEEYYKRYFSDRSRVVAEHNKYRSVFEELRLGSESLKRELDALAADVQSKRSDYEIQARSLQNDIGDFNRRASQGEFESQSEFTTERQTLVNRSRSLESLRAEINASINRYNALVTELNSIATETNDLNRSLDSNLEPAPSL